MNYDRKTRKQTIVINVTVGNAGKTIKGKQIWLFSLYTVPITHVVEGWRGVIFWKNIWIDLTFNTNLAWKTFVTAATNLIAGFCDITIEM